MSQLTIESLRVEPCRIPELVPIWREIAEHVFTRPRSTKANWRNRIEVQKHILVYDCVGSRDEFWGPLVEVLRPWYKAHLSDIWNDAHDQSSFARFLTTRAGERLLVDALAWLQPAWELATDWFWKSAVEDNDFGELLEHAWRHKFNEIRANPLALKAFKTLTLKLAAHHVTVAMEVQQHIGC